jgi:hypothetical protein
LHDFLSCDVADVFKDRIAVNTNLTTLRFTPFPIASCLCLKQAALPEALLLSVCDSQLAGNNRNSDMKNIIKNS